MPIRTPLLALAALALPGAALAHTGHDVGGFGYGFAHPLGGLDHLLAMLAVGLWAAQAGGRALWAVPASFLALMAAGGGLALAGVGLPAVELGVAGSVLAFGLLVACAARIPLGAGIALTGAFALFHGFAHGAEMAAGASAALYGGGFLAATALLHAAGMIAGQLGRYRLGAVLVRAGGAATAAAGATLLAGLG
ncbi:HupE/UreJ family protein [Spiribacter halobius]|uniref:Urease accessory protein n=1 Tax=Sediminicurvatus halobius TaxID=2182432 RepID=A0A2U2N977_9GAMM|nr:HupE/UreJ family protein [Spiribacter halobius]PWG65716.1 urease accessory protein [Spiribacter halobius]UEX77750.1 HupE/UreJ family protein [Spiribacter halobius]